MIVHLDAILLLFPSSLSLSLPLLFPPLPLSPSPPPPLPPSLPPSFLFSALVKKLISEIDKDLFQFFEASECRDYLFCHRWLLLNFKRELNIDRVISK